MSDIAVVGAGYVGLVTSACLSHRGHTVSVLDINAEKVARLSRGEVPIYEPELESLVQEGLKTGRLTFGTDPAAAISGREFIFIAVQTPGDTNGQADLMALMTAMHSIAPHLSDDSIIVQKSTVPVGTAALLEEMLASRNGHSPHLVSNPEFLREGSAVRDFLEPDRVVLGANDPHAATRVAELFSFATCPVLKTTAKNAEMIKYASNSFLATKISFMNEIANICEAYSADVSVVAEGMGLDPRIGPSFLKAGVGWGGSCFPKDIKALIHMARVAKVTPRILEAAQRVNSGQRKQVTQKLERHLGDLKDKIIGMLGLSFKPGTDDLRSAPSLTIASSLIRRGARVRAHDPVAAEHAKRMVPGIEVHEDPYELSKGAHALVLVTEWPEYAELDLSLIRQQMRKPVLIDGRNLWNRAEAEALGFTYAGFGVAPSEDEVRKLVAEIAALSEVA